MTMKLKYCALLVITLQCISACGENTAVTPGETVAETVAVKLPKSGQTLCYNAAGETIDCAGTGQDGELKSGGAWTDPRFFDQNNGTLLDSNTGLIWPREATVTSFAACSYAPSKNWQAALEYVTCLNTNSYLGLVDWRLPNVLELQSLVNVAQPDNSAWLISQGFTGVVADTYWSSTSAADGPSSAWGVDMGVGAVDGDDKSDISNVWPVRSEPTGKFEYALPYTGQTLCYDSVGAEMVCSASGQDGSTHKGAAWTNFRFIDLMDGTVQDHLTDLIWSKSANAPGPPACSPAMTKNWQASLEYVSCLNANSYLGFSDWRLPNRYELSSLVDYAQLNQAMWLTDRGFTDVQAVYYWSSTTTTGSTSNAWGVDIGDGDVDGDNKSYSQFVWPVRN